MTIGVLVFVIVLGVALVVANSEPSIDDEDDMNLWYNQDGEG